MNSDFFNQLVDIGNHAILDGYCKADNVLRRRYTPLCSISGGSDSDVVLDIIHRMDESNKVQYYWIDTGLEYEATKEHLSFLESKYNITIQHIRPVKPISQLTLTSDSRLFPTELMMKILPIILFQLVTAKMLL